MESEMDGPKESPKNPLLRLCGWLSGLWGWLSGQRADEGDPLNKPTEAYGKLEEDRYKAELQLVDRYQSFVAELLRLSLLGIAVFGFLYKEMFTDLGPSPLLTIGGVSFTIGGVAKILAAAGVFLFGLAAVAALLFRFAATEGARYYIEGLRFPIDMRRAQKSLNMRSAKIASPGAQSQLLGLCLV